METKKIDEFTLEITKEVPAPEVVTTKYERAFIEEQIISITKQRDEMISLKEKEIKECENILAEMDNLGIISKPIQEDLKSTQIEEKLPIS